MTRQHQFAAGLAVVWTAVVGYLGLTESRGVIGLPDEIAEPAHHFVSFALLAALFVIAFPKRWLGIGLTLAVVGIAGEVLQLTTDDRQFDAVDIAMNLIGIAAGLGFVAVAKNPTGVVFGCAGCLLLAGPFVLPTQNRPTAFPRECMAAPAPAGGEPILLFDGLSGTDDSAIDDVSVADIKDAIVQTSEFSIEAWFETPNLQQTGPARVFTISEGINPREMNLHLGVEGSSLSVRFRTSCELSNRLLIDDVIRVGQLQHVVVNWSGGVLETWVDGALVDRTEVPWGDFSSWDSDFTILVGDEVGGGRAFDGTVASVSLWDRALDAQQIAERSSAPS